MPSIRTSNPNSASDARLAALTAAASMLSSPPVFPASQLPPPPLEGRVVCSRLKVRTQHQNRVANKKTRLPAQPPSLAELARVTPRQQAASEHRQRMAARERKRKRMRGELEGAAPGVAGLLSSSSSSSSSSSEATTPTTSLKSTSCPFQREQVAEMNAEYTRRESLAGLNRDLTAQACVEDMIGALEEAGLKQQQEEEQEDAAVQTLKTWRNALQAQAHRAEQVWRDVCGQALQTVEIGDDQKREFAGLARQGKVRRAVRVTPGSLVAMMLLARYGYAVYSDARDEVIRRNGGGVHGDHARPEGAGVLCL
ncbi:uncharacterized protein HMPREF1541_03740 [Cyphellophora europaea CBS 101466]|uniref:Uncharacterized protein n=1 Tax=Cyphellophora europaea (strain CBS 101466) TaxID=1220924 RepID=W2S167_CYPE1|nr:uncharacterized protein HMPREF1541_03740 [Cyphellophora europaea CBS 101466]ETN41803.1 hypothetical protein HMPREF1541_03740 [Cyphellophora europaea CBS 101466]